MKTLLNRAGICTDALARVNAFLAANGLRPVAAETWRDSVRPAMLAAGDAEAIGTGKRVAWLYDAKALWRWQEYIAKRQVLIALGADGWHSKRRYCEDDALWLVDEGGLDGKIDHPLFDVALGMAVPQVAVA